MLRHMIWICFVICLQSVHSVMSQSFCDNMTIDAITYVKDTKMYFIASDGFFWYIPSNDLPPKEEKKIKLPAPFKRPTAAVYLDTIDECANARSKKVSKEEKHVWITEMIGTTVMFARFDTRVSVNQWSQPIQYNADRCLGRAKITYDHPIDAMWTTGYLKVFFISNGYYAMNDCIFVCTDPDGFGSDSPRKQSLKDFKINGSIDDIVWSTNDNKMYLFQKNVFYESKLPKVSNDSKITDIQPTNPQDIRTKFLKFKNDSDCSLVTTTSASVNSSLDTKSDEGPNPTEESVNDNGERFGSKLWIIFLIIVILVIE